MIQQINELITTHKQNGGSANLVSDSWHTFEDLYEHRRVLTLIIAKSYPEYAWKAKLHADGTMFDDSFIVGFTTPAGQYSYHYHLKFWDEFDGVEELPASPEYDGHQPEDIDRLLSILTTPQK